jgi:hypothetical protein
MALLEFERIIFQAITLSFAASECIFDGFQPVNHQKI